VLYIVLHDVTKSKNTSITSKTKLLWHQEYYVKEKRNILVMCKILNGFVTIGRI